MRLVRCKRLCPTPGAGKIILELLFWSVKRKTYKHENPVTTNLRAVSCKTSLARLWLARALV
jgi:hypothetical protein